MTVMENQAGQLGPSDSPGDSPPGGAHKSTTRRLGFKEIVPGHDPTDPSPGAHEGGVPEFDLGHQMMARHRRMTSAKRKGPGRKNSEEMEIDRPVPVEQTQLAAVPCAMVQSGMIWALYSSAEKDDLIAEIVAEDIRRLWAGERVFA